ncbi:MAG: hypothetical protein N2253_01660 [Bacteroidia bacterium]|nr:hypothetical protein [Bacteroidia bacterium]MCX7763583.1 hypothetical protein [Bacteroidia bacterium]MDW8057800.1 hypothetical protein [Bacteroidia bacterium]
MRWFVLWLALGWAQVWEVRALLEGRGEGEIVLHFLSSSGEKVVNTRLREGRAQIRLEKGFSFREVILRAEGYLPVRLLSNHTEGGLLDFTRPANLHPKSGYLIHQGKAILAAGELGSLPEETQPTINAYDIELFLQAHKRQDLRADFTGDGKVDEQDLKLLLKNQALLLRTEL